MVGSTSVAAQAGKTFTASANDEAFSTLARFDHPVFPVLAKRAEHGSMVSSTLRNLKQQY